VSVTVELPGAEKGDLSLHVADQAVTVRVDKGARRYHKKIRLPAKVVPGSAKATFKNGILDVTLKRAGEREHGENVRID
jgi:HSP20 family protein